MLYSGLTSVTFRKLQPEEIIQLVSRAGLHGIEWGGDIHVPHGDLKRAKEVGAMTRDAGLAVSSYGSYYQAGKAEENNCTYDAVLETAKALGAPMVRIWAGNAGSGSADEAYRDSVTTDTQKMAEAAEKLDIGISFEYHGNTLTDTCDSAIKLLESVSRQNAGCYWQPNPGQRQDDCLADIARLKQWITNIHAFCWVDYDRRPLSDGIDVWNRYLSEIAGIPGDRYVLLEFVKNDLPEQFLQDALVLKKLLGE